MRPAVTARLSAPRRSDRFDARGLYDASLALTRDGPVTGNDVAADGRQLIMVTGANQGGKSRPASGSCS